MENIRELEGAIAALESQRGVLGDSVVDLAQQSLREKLSRLQPAAVEAEQQRKWISVLFADIVGSTQVGKDRDPEQLLEIMDSALQSLAEPVARHYGRVTRFMGDGFIALFGLPLAYEDDAERAVRAGLEILQVAGRIAQDFERKYQVSGFNVRLGINSGLVATGGYSEAEDTVMGLNVNLAQRLESAAPPGGLLISQATHRLVEGLFETSPVAPVNAKGFEQPVPAFLVQRAVRLRHFLPGMPADKPDDLLVGRDAELLALQECYHSALRDSRSAFVFLVGEPGMGKRRLHDALLDWVGRQAAGAITFQGRASSAGSRAPYSLLREVFSNAFDILDGDPAEVVRRKIETGFGEHLGEESQMKAHWIAALLGYELQDDPFLASIQSAAEPLRLRALHYLVEYFTALLQEKPVVISLEAIQSADSLSLEAIHSLAAELRQLPFLVICLSRPAPGGLLTQMEAACQRDGVVIHRLDLLALSPEASRMLMGRILRQDSLPQPLLEAVVGASAGNPYFIAELLKIMVEDGIVEAPQEGGAARVDLSRLDKLRLPATLTALIQARLDSLQEDEKNTLQRAAVIGDEFWDGTLQALDGSPSNLEAALERLAQRGLIDACHESQFSGLKEYFFASSILREVTYETVLLRKRQVYHQLAGDWLVSAALQAGRQGEYAAVIAGHYHQAGQDRQAARWYLSAGERSMRQGASLEARRFFDLALHGLPLEDHESRWQALVMRSEVLGILGDYPARVADDAALLALAQELNDFNHLAEAYYHKGSFAFTTGDDRQAVEDFRQASAAARKAGNLDIEADSLSLLAHRLFRLGRYPEADESAQKALQRVAAVRDEAARARTYTNLAVYYGEAGDVPRAMGLFGELVEITRQMDERLGLAVNLSNLGYNRLLLGLYEDGLHALEESLRVSEGIGAHHNNAFTRLNFGLASLLLGDHARARQELERAIRELGSLQDPYGEAAGQNYLGRALETAGEIPQAMEQYQLAYNTFVNSSLPEYANDARAGLARCLLRRGQVAAAQACALQLWEDLRARGGVGMEFPILAFTTCAQTFTALKDLHLAQEALALGYRQLMQRADRITDPAWRAAYLENVPENRVLVENWRIYFQEV